MSTPSTCAGEPLSWLLLERYALGELPDVETSRVRAHLARCPACAVCAAEAARPLPVVVRDPAPPVHATTLRAPWFRRYASAWATTAALAGAAAGFLLLARARGRSIVATGETMSGVKGGATALELVREREGTIAHGAETFTPDDRWKALVTCPSGRIVFWDVTVRDGDRGAVRFPLAPAGPISCGNHVVLPGAFRLRGTGTAAVCVRLAADPLPRNPSGQDGVGTDHEVCVSLRPEH